MKLNRYLSQKKIGMMVIGMIIILIIIGFMNKFVFSHQVIVLKDKSITIEYGNTISSKVNDYLDLNQMKKEVVDDIKMDTSSIKYEYQKNYPAIGNYVVKLTYKDEQAILNLKVKDTIAPVFKDFQTEMEFVKGHQPTDEELKTLFKVEDLDQTTITMDHTKIDYTKTGVYKTTIIASDSSLNKEVKDIMVNISEPTIQLDQTKATLYVKEHFVLKAKIKGNDHKVHFQSSDNSVVEVDDQGKVMAKKSGTAHIIAEANGVKAECQITVKSQATGETTVQKDSYGNQVTVVKPPQRHKKPNTGSSSNGSDKTDGSYDLAGAKQAFQLQNKERSKQGLPALKWSDSLYETAKIRAKEIVTQFSHTRPNGGDIFNMIKISWRSAAENIGMGTPSASSMVDLWMNSAGHKANILADNTHAAVAKYGNHWVTIFVKQ